MGPYQRTPKKVTRAIKYPGLGVRSVGPVGDFLDNLLHSSGEFQLSTSLGVDFFHRKRVHSHDWLENPRNEGCFFPIGTWGVWVFHSSNRHVVVNSGGVLWCFFFFDRETFFFDSSFRFGGFWSRLSFKVTGSNLNAAKFSKKHGWHQQQVCKSILKVREDYQWFVVGCVWFSLSINESPIVIPFSPVLDFPATFSVGFPGTPNNGTPLW